MKTTNYRMHKPEAGQALALAQHRPANIVLAEGELVLQPAARWLGGRLVVDPATRVAAPAMLTVDAGCSVIAAGRATVLVEETAPALALLAAWWKPAGGARPAAA